MNNNSGQLDSLLELDNRHDELLRRLEELDKQVEMVLAEWLASRAGPAMTAHNDVQSGASA